MGIQTELNHLEKLALKEAVKYLKITQQFSVLIVAEQQPNLPIQFAHLGANVVWVDLTESELSNRKWVRENHLTSKIFCLPLNLPHIPKFPFNETTFDLIFLRDFISQMNYSQAGCFIEDWIQKLKIGGKLFIEVLGYNQPFNEKYFHQQKKVRERFCPLYSQVAQKYNIKHSVCLYSERDLNLLLLETGLSSLRSWVSSQGYIQAIAVKI